MALPLNSAPVYTLKLPSTGKDIKYRPFLIKEEKALLLANQSEDPTVMVDSLKQVIKSCVKDEIDVDSFATFDLEYVFTQIRAKSVGENVELLLKCDTCTDEKAVAKVTLDLTQIEIQKDPDHTNKIELFGDVGVIMKYPTIEILKKLEALTSNNLDEVFNVVSECIESVYDSDQVWAAKDTQKAELLEFLNNLSSEQFQKVQRFFETMPKLKKEVSYKCPVCGTQHDKVLEGLQSFF